MFRGQRTLQHPQLGLLTWSRRTWRGTVSVVDDASVELSIMGKRSGPDPDALELARTIEHGASSWRPSIDAAILQHGADAGADVEGMPDPSYVAVIAIDGSPAIEFGFQVPWDDDHMIGICVRNDVVIEVNGSVLQP